MPDKSSTDQLAAVVENQIVILNNPPLPTPFLQRGDPTYDAIRQLQIIFNIPNNNNDTCTNNGTNNL